MFTIFRLYADVTLISTNQDYDVMERLQISSIHNHIGQEELIKCKSII